MKKSIPVHKDAASFRWCDRKDSYVSIDVCKTRCKTKPACGRCYTTWKRTRLQPQLPFGMGTKK